MKVLITGTFDPITRGHMEMIWKAADVFGTDNIIVAVMSNLDKDHLLSITQRTKLVKEAVPYYIEVIFRTGMINDLIQSYQEQGNVIIVRGLRNTIDYEYEKSVESFTNTFGADTVYINSSPETQHISSSLVRNLILAKMDYSSYMPNMRTYDLITKYLDE